MRWRMFVPEVMGAEVEEALDASLASWLPLRLRHNFTHYASTFCFICHMRALDHHFKELVEGTMRRHITSNDQEILEQMFKATRPCAPQPSESTQNLQLQAAEAIVAMNPSAAH